MLFCDFNASFFGFEIYQIEIIIQLVCHLDAHEFQNESLWLKDPISH